MQPQPATDPTADNSKQAGLRLPKDLAEELEAAAAALSANTWPKVSRSDLIRIACREWLARNRPKAK